MIGIGYYDSDNWKYYNLTVKSLTDLNEKEILIQFQTLLQELDYDIIMHWSNAEISFLNTANQKHNLDIKLNNNVDLRKIFEYEPIAIKGLFNYKLKEVVKVMNFHNLINIQWDEISDGLEAMILTWKYDEYCKKNNISLTEHHKFKEIINYNEIDCKAMYEMLIYIKKNHI